MDFMNDYYFLEEATRFTKKISENVKVKNQNRLNFRFQRLRKEANARDVKLYFLNNGLTKRKKNQSVFKAQEQAIYWFVELIFGNASNFTICKKFSENTKVQDILSTCLDNKDDENRDKQLDFYRAEGVNKLRVLMKSEGLKNSNNRYHELNLKKSLKSNLKRKVVIEYPTLLVVLEHSAGDFEVVPSDGELNYFENFSFISTFIILHF